MGTIRSKSISHKLKRTIAFAGWRRNISGKEKLITKELRSKKINL